MSKLKLFFVLVLCVSIIVLIGNGYFYLLNKEQIVQTPTVEQIEQVEDETWGKQIGKPVILKDENGNIQGYTFQYRDKVTKRYVYITISNTAYNSTAIDTTGYMK